MSNLDNKKYWASYKEHAIAIIPKCGNTSFSNLIGSINKLTIEETLKIEKRIMFIREPFDRFISAYSFFHMLNCDERGHMRVPREATHNGYESFVDFALNNYNPHWAPQMELTGGIATHLYKFNCNNIRKWWPIYWSGRQPDWLNACSHLPANTYRINEILDYYSVDSRAFEGAV